MPIDTHIASSAMCLFKSLAHVLTELSIFILLTWKVLSTFWIQTICHTWDLLLDKKKLSSPISDLVTGKQQVDSVSSVSRLS